MAKDTWGARLYRGEQSYDIVGRARIWYVVSGVILVIAIAGLLVRGLNEGIEFKGGDVFEFPSNGHSVSDARTVVEGRGHANPIVTKNSAGTIRVQTEPITSTTSEDEVAKVRDALATTFGIDKNSIAVQQVGPTWGKQITKKALYSLIAFLVAVIIFISARFEPKMAAAAIVALAHDVLITVGVYAVAGFEVTPATVIGLLTILGYSLYDTVVVFDKVRENTAGIVGGNRMTYSQAANLAVNQTLVRSINTSVIALLPVGAILFIGAFVLGAGTLKDLALALFVGLAAGTYSSVFIATPLLAGLREREPQMQLLARRVEARVNAGKAPTAGTARAAGAPGAGGVRSATAVLDRPADADGPAIDPVAGAGAVAAGGAGATAAGGGDDADQERAQQRAQQRRQQPRPSAKRRRSHTSRPKGGRKKRR